ncbi:MAG TPA: di-heme oxidoredictase family protein [Bryobacteraceae bacterium]|nr:di-heme oxidoredictase family protein [Bryobacteraceae bacterium]
MTRWLLLSVAVASAVGTAQEFHPSIPIPWDDSETTSFELPLAQADRSPRYPSTKDYYSLAVRPVYRTYPFYAPDMEPAGYWELLQQKEPEVVFDPAKLKTKEDWIRAGELVFDEPIVIVPPTSRRRYQANYRAVPMPTTPEGIVPGWFYLVRKKGVVELGFGSCAECHVRVMPDGSVVKGAQTNLPVSESQAWRYTDRGTGPEVVQRFRLLNRAQFFVPWAANQDDWDHITLEEIVRRLQAKPPGVVEREGTSTKHPARVPSLIGIEDLRYLDATGLSRNRNAGDLMRYAIVNQGLIRVARYGDYDPQGTPTGGNTRYSDEQLYALSLYLESLKPPPNPNPFDDEARRGQVIFSRQGCTGCHPAPLYTNNKLTPAKGFTIPQTLRNSEGIIDVCVGTDPGLALETRRGTGFYKVPSLRGVWMRSVFGHEGQAASLEEWLDPARLSADYVPNGFHLAPGPIQGHEYGIKLSVADRKSLIAFLKTL